MEILFQSISGTLHILSASTLVGSMIYSQLAVVPALKHLGTPRSHAINLIAFGRFSAWTWASLIILIVTGVYAFTDNLKKLAPVQEKPAGMVLAIKLLLVGVLIGILLFQNYNLGPRLKKLINPATPKDQENILSITKTSNSSQYWSQLHLLIGLVIIILAVILSVLLESGG